MPKTALYEVTYKEKNKEYQKYIRAVSAIDAHRTAKVAFGFLNHYEIEKVDQRLAVTIDNSYGQQD